jgi:hypothetical protein
VRCLSQNFIIIKHQQLINLAQLLSIDVDINTNQSLNCNNHAAYALLSGGMPSLTYFKDLIV